MNLKKNICAETRRKPGVGHGPHPASQLILFQFHEDEDDDEPDELDDDTKKYFEGLRKCKKDNKEMEKFQDDFSLKIIEQKPIILNNINLIINNIIKNKNKDENKKK